MKPICKKCGREVTHDEMAMNWKMLNRGATTYFCLTCLAEYFKVDEQNLKDKMEYFRKMGCKLF